MTDRRHSGQPLSMDVRMRLGINLRRFRMATGLSQEAFGDFAQIHRTYVSDLERGRRNPTITIVDKLAVALSVAPGDLLNEPEQSDLRAGDTK